MPVREWTELREAIAAARAGDEPRLRALVDWPLSGVALVTTSLAGLEPADRAEAAGSGLAELAAARGDASVVELVLPPIAARLADAREVRPADESKRVAVLRQLQVREVPVGLTADQSNVVARLQRRAAALVEVYLVADTTGEMPVARAADTGQLVLLLH